MKEVKNDLRFERTRNKLVQSYTQLVMSNLSNKVLDICYHANVTAMTFYHHFDDKNDFLQYYVNRQLQGYLPIPKKLKPINLNQFVYYTVSNLFRLAESNRPVLTNSLRKKNYSYLDLVDKTITCYTNQELSVILNTWDQDKIINTTDLMLGGIFRLCRRMLLNNLPLTTKLMWKTIKDCAAQLSCYDK